MAATRAIRFLSGIKAPFDVLTYVHDEKGAAFAASATGFPLDRTVKTLVVDLGKKGYAVALMPGNRQLALKRMARVLSARRAAMADKAMAERLSGYTVGGISPFGMKKAMPAAMDDRLLGPEKVMINGGKRGLMLVMSPRKIAALLNCIVAPLSA